jgi:hypothetical protein
MFKTQLAEIVAAIPAYDFEKIPGQPKILFENINAVITRDGKSTGVYHILTMQKKPRSTGYNPKP